MFHTFVYVLEERKKTPVTIVGHLNAWKDKQLVSEGTITAKNPIDEIVM